MKSAELNCAFVVVVFPSSAQFLGNPLYKQNLVQIPQIQEQGTNYSPFSPWPHGQVFGIYAVIFVISLLPQCVGTPSPEKSMTKHEPHLCKCG